MATLLNWPFLTAVFNAIAPHSIFEWLFFFSVPVLLCALCIIVMTISGALFFPRFIIGVHFVVSAILFYATSTYGVIFDKGMIQNIMETNSGEAGSYLNLGLVLFFVFFCLFPLIAIFSQNVQQGFFKKLKGIIKLNVIALICVVAILGAFYKDYASVGRNHKALSKSITPFTFYDSFFKYVKHTYLAPPLPYRILDKSPELVSSDSLPPRTLVVVVGETARADKFSLNGYTRNTNPLLEHSNAVTFRNVSSCGTATAVSVPCMFSRLSRDEYSDRMASSQDNVLDIIHRAGVDVTWIDNNSSCKGVCKRVNTIEFDAQRDKKLCDGDYCFDQILVNELKDAISQKSKSNKVIILHMIGSHGPTYYRRYPAGFKQFVPDCPQSDIQNCSQQQLINTYDNTILYTDYILNEVINNLKNTPNSAMLYISDHGESLGENGMYLHGFPYALAPDEQKHVPMIYWDSHFSDTNYKSCIEEKSATPVSHDNLFDLMLGLSDVKSSVYQAQQDLFSYCKNTKAF
ncbi:phosphoethanolamine--lipid A transferase [Neptunicella marina]|uniref:Phosphoethanolamine--lipid A transferase n=2 Tax=Neptunicella marina TaxID=2125989 RepID=A0A8J6J084_9ALTE|nr:phosphoethanolamine--lipid A transferase [Neptunicella marina]